MKKKYIFGVLYIAFMMQITFIGYRIFNPIKTKASVSLQKNKACIEEVFDELKDIKGLEIVEINNNSNNGVVSKVNIKGDKQEVLKSINNIKGYNILSYSIKSDKKEFYISLDIKKE